VEAAQRTPVLGSLVANIYRTDAEHQYAQGVDTVAQMFRHVTVHAGMKHWPPNIINMLMLLSIAIKRLYSDNTTRELTPQMVCKEMQEIALKAGTSQIVPTQELDVRESVAEQASNVPTGDCHRVSAEDLSCALIYLQSLSKDSLLDFGTYRSQAIVDTKMGEQVSFSLNEMSGNVRHESEARNREDMDSHDSDLDAGNKELENHKQGLPSVELEIHSQHSADHIIPEQYPMLRETADPEPTTAIKPVHEVQVTCTHAQTFRDEAVQVHCEDRPESANSRESATSRESAASRPEEPLQLVKHILELENRNRALVEQVRLLQVQVQDLMFH